MLWRYSRSFPPTVALEVKYKPVAIYKFFKGDCDFILVSNQGFQPFSWCGLLQSGMDAPK